MACCAVLQKWHWQILEESSASVSGCFSFLFPIAVSVSFFSLFFFYTLPLLVFILSSLLSAFISLNLPASFFRLSCHRYFPSFSPLCFLLPVIADVCSFVSNTFHSFPHSTFHPDYSYHCVLILHWVYPFVSLFVRWVSFEYSKPTVCLWVLD